MIPLGTKLPDMYARLDPLIKKEATWLTKIMSVQNKGRQSFERIASDRGEAIQPVLDFAHTGMSL